MSQLRKRGATPGRDRDRDAMIRTKRADNRESVEVVCRLTPYTGRSPCLTIVNETALTCAAPPGVYKRDGSNYPPKVFDFGFVFDESDDQPSVFNRCCSDLIGHFITGKNSLLFTYGVTGSGKTYTMTGKPTANGAGLLPRTLDVVFNSIENQMEKCVLYPNGRNGFSIQSKLDAHIARKRLELNQSHSQEIENRYTERTKIDGYNDNYLCSVFVSYVEIYNNFCYDLLDRSVSPVKKDTRMDPAGAVYVDGASEVEVETADEALEVFCRGEERRRTSDTLLNKESSRSHSVFTGPDSYVYSTDFDHRVGFYSYGLGPLDQLLEVVNRPLWIFVGDPSLGAHLMNRWVTLPRVISLRLVMIPIDDLAPGLQPLQDADQIIVSQLALVDLAGSERAKRTLNAGERLAEAGAINKSLMTLRQCIDKLRKNQRSSNKEAVPYRDSKLTLLFKNYFEGSGKIRMVICANPKPDDYEENLNVLAFAEESQAVTVNRAEERLVAQDENRPPVPRRFFSKWNHEIDQMVSRFEFEVSVSALPPSFAVKDYHDSAAIQKLMSYYEANSTAVNTSSDVVHRIMHDVEPALRSALCLLDHRSQQLEELLAEKEKHMQYITELQADNKKMKRATQSLHQRLTAYEAVDEEALNAEEELRKSRQEDRARLRKQAQTLKAVQDLCEGAPSSPNVAQLRDRFASQEPPSSSRRNVMQASQTSSSGRSTNRLPRQNSGGRTPAASTPVAGPGYFNPKYHRRSKSAPRTVDHKPTHRVPTGGILRVKQMPNSVTTTHPEARQLRQSTDYVLTHQEVDDVGNISTSIVKGECIPTAGGGTAVLFNDVERLTHESPAGNLPPRHRRSKRSRH